MIIIRDNTLEELNIPIAGYQKGNKLSKDEVIALFKKIKGHADANQFYVGITCDPDRREGEHKADFLAVVDCPTMEAAQDLEARADEYGFDAGDVQGNVHKSSSKKVYIYKKTPDTEE